MSILGSLSLYDEKSLAKLTEIQRSRAWDLERSIDWSRAIDLNKPLVPLDEKALFFPGASSEERLAISQMMGLVVASSIFEMEECLIRLRKTCWSDFTDQFPISPEFEALGEQFFEEEQKHSQAFRRYVDKYSEALGVDPSVMESLLPRIENTKTEAILKANLRTGGQTFWWIVAAVEQEFLMLYHAIRPFEDHVEPLYYELHEKHFEEEARHSPFPYLMVELLVDRNKRWLNFVHVKGDLIVAQFLQTFWSFSSLARLRDLKKYSEVHPFFEVLAHAYPKLEAQPLDRVFWQFLTSAPYISSLVNLQCHKKMLRFAKKVGAIHLPYPEHRQAKLVKY